MSLRIERISEQLSASLRMVSQKIITLYLSVDVRTGISSRRTVEKIQLGKASLVYVYYA